MDEDSLNDLKQFISTTISQQTSDLVARLDKVDVRLDKVDVRLASVGQKIDDLSVSVTDALDNFDEATDTQLKDHEKRIKRLEHKTA